MTTYAINGLGRVGKLALRPLLESGAQIAWVNDAVGDAAMQAHLLEFQAAYGALYNRIAAFVALPIETPGRASLQAHLDAIAKEHPAQ